jgi:hypothetical protein
MWQKNAILAIFLETYFVLELGVFYCNSVENEYNKKVCKRFESK